MDTECEYYSYVERVASEGPIGDECYRCEHLGCSHNSDYAEQSELVL
jgi:hypothetical protein